MENGFRFSSSSIVFLFSVIIVYLYNIYMHEVSVINNVLLSIKNTRNSMSAFYNNVQSDLPFKLCGH